MPEDKPPPVRVGGHPCSPSSTYSPLPSNLRTHSCLQVGLTAVPQPGSQMDLEGAPSGTRVQSGLWAKGTSDCCKLGPRVGVTLSEMESVPWPHPRVGVPLPKTEPVLLRPQD